MRARTNARRNLPISNLPLDAAVSGQQLSKLPVAGCSGVTGSTIVLNRIYTPGAVWTHTVCSRGLEIDVHEQVGQVSRLGLSSKHGIFSRMD
jgi:hypothetical protein